MASAQKTVNEKPLLEISGLKTVFPTDDGIVNAVNDVSFKIARGQTVGVVGESGCGKSYHWAIAAPTRAVTGTY